MCDFSRVNKAKVSRSSGLNGRDYYDGVDDDDGGAENWSGLPHTTAKGSAEQKSVRAGWWREVRNVVQDELSPITSC